MKHITGFFFRGGVTLLALMGGRATVWAEESVEKGKQLPASILRKYDADHNGVLNEDEKAAWKADLQRGRAEAQSRRLEQYDANKDGKLDKTEKAAAKAGGVKKPGDSSKRDKGKPKSGSPGAEAEGSAGEEPDKTVALRSP